MSQSPAEIIREQLGMQCFLLLGAKNVFSDNEGRTLRFNIGKNAKGVQLVEITLDPNDTYTVRFSSKRKKTIGGFISGYVTKVHAESTNVYFDALHDILEAKTGLYTSLHPRR